MSYITTVCLYIALFDFQSCLAAEKQAEWYQEQRFLYFGVPVQLRFKGGDQALADRVWAYLESIDEHFNDYKEDSEVGKINKRGIGQHQVSQIMQDAIQQSFQLHVLSDGAFDITVGPLRRLWKGAAKSGIYPEQQSIEKARTLVGMKYLSLQGAELSLTKKQVTLDFGGMVKGLAVDQAMRMLIDAGIKDALVQVGGETACMGISPRGKPHALAIPDPKNPRGFYQVVEDIGSGYSGCTSGNYRLPIIINGKPYYHIFDPKTGEPGKTHTLSVSIIFPRVGRNALADGLSTSGVVMGHQRIIPLVESLGGECLVLVQSDDGSVQAHQSAGWQRFVRKPTLKAEDKIKDKAQE